MHVNFLHDAQFASSLPSPKIPPHFFTLTPKIVHPWPRKLNFSPRISFFTQNYSLEGCFNVGNSEHVKDVEAKIIVQVPDGKYKSLRHLCDILWFLRLVIGCLRLYRGSRKYQLVPVKDRPAIIYLSKITRDHNSFCKLDFFYDGDQKALFFTKNGIFQQFLSNFPQKSGRFMKTHHSELGPYLVKFLIQVEI